MLITLVSGVFTTLASNPFWLIQAKMSVDTTNAGFVQFIKTIVNKEGVLALWKGTCMGFILISNPMINFVIYEKFKRMIFDDDNSYPHMITIFAISIVSKFVATIVTYPLITFRTKAYTSNKDMSVSQRLSLFIKQEGLGAFYRGIHTKLVRTLLSNALTMIIFEYARYFLTGTN
jgi:adenine nucleotide transporter 17